MREDDGKKIIEDGDLFHFETGEWLYTPINFGINGCLYYGAGHTIHVYTGNNESGADVEVDVHDNIHMEIFGKRKHHPTFVIRHDEFPCTIRIKKTPNMTVIVEEEQS